MQRPIQRWNRILVISMILASLSLAGCEDSEDQAEPQPQPSLSQNSKESSAKSHSSKRKQGPRKIIGPRISRILPWDNVLNSPEASNVQWGISIGGANAYERDVDAEFPIASLTKLFISHAALTHLGADFRFETHLQWGMSSSSGDSVAYGLKLIGSGDPTSGMLEYGEGPNTRFDQMAAELRRRGITEVRGPITVAANDSRWFDVRTPEGWDPSDWLSCDGTVAQALNNDINCAVYRILSPTSGTWEPGEITTPVRVNLVPGKMTDIRATRDGSGYILEGTLRLNRGTTLYLPVLDSSNSVARMLASALERQKIRLDPDATVPPSLTARDYTFFSPALKDILRPYLKESLNFIGDALFKELGRQFGDPGARDLYQAAQAALEQDFGRWAHFHDGSGVSVLNRSTARSVLEFMDMLSSAPDFPVIWNALAIAGVDGTLRARMSGTAAQGFLRGKTGTLKGFYHLAGYVPAKTGGYIPFVSLGHANESDRNRIHRVEDRIGALLATLNRAN